MITISEVACFSFPSLNKEMNEDCIFSPIQTKDDSVYLAVADGVGSLDGSGSASKSVILSINKSINDSKKQFNEIFKDAYNAVSALDKKIATTLTIVKVDRDSISIGHIGDCRAYVLNNGKLTQLTIDHTRYQSLIRSGEFNRHQLRKHKNRLSSILTSAIAKEYPLNYEEFKFNINEFKEDGSLVIYLMSDGAYHHWDKRKHFSKNTMSSPSSFASSLRKRIEKEIIDDYSLVGVKININEGM